MPAEPVSPHPYQFSLRLLFAAITATAVQCGILFGSPWLMAVLATECFLGFLSLAGAVVLYDELRSTDGSPLNMLIAGWITGSAVGVGVYLMILVAAGGPG
jgi:hypothetical protein